MFSFLDGFVLASFHLQGFFTISLKAFFLQWYLLKFKINALRWFQAFFLFIVHPVNGFSDLLKMPLQSIHFGFVKSFSNQPK